MRQLNKWSNIGFGENIGIIEIEICSLSVALIKSVLQIRCLFLFLKRLFLRDDSNEWSYIGFGQEIKELASIEIHFTHLICSPDIVSAHT